MHSHASGVMVMKIPFEATISGAYRFAFTNILSIVGIAWFPFLVLTGVMGGLIALCFPTLKGAFPQGHEPTAENLQGMAIIFGLGLVFTFGWIVAIAMVNVGIMRKALGQHPGPVFFFFSLGGQVWRLIGSYVLLTIIFFLGTIGIELVVIAVSFAVQKAAPAAQIPVTVLLAVIAVCWMIYAAVRVMFFIPAVVVAENHIGIARSWQLGRGNFWRIVGIILLIWIPLGTAAGIIFSTVVQISAGGMMIGSAAGPEEAARVLKNFGEIMTHAGPVLVVIELLYMILFSGLTNGASGTAYNLVTGSGEA